MTIVISVADLDWCGAAGGALIGDISSYEVAGHPVVNRAVTAWDRSNGTPVWDTINGSHPPHTKGFTVGLPAAHDLKRWFLTKGTPSSASAEVQAYVASVVLHELIHTRQAPADAPSTRPVSAADFLAYYEDPREQEAHGAQVAYALLAVGAAASDEAVLGTLVGGRIASRLAPLASTELAGRAALAQQDLVKAVEDWMTRLP